MEKEINGEIPEEVVDFLNEPEPINWLKKESVFASGGLDFKDPRIVRIYKKSKAGKDYTAYRIYVRDTYGEYVIGDIMRSQMKWGKVNPKEIHVTTEKKNRDGKDYQDFVIVAK